MTPASQLPLLRLRQQAALLDRRWQTSRARVWLHAWLTELLGLMPAPLRARLTRAPAVQRLTWPFSADADVGRPCVLVLPAPMVMAHTLNLPSAAIADLQRVMAFEIDRYTPYCVDEVHFAARVENRSGDKAAVLLVAISRERLAAVLHYCQTLGVPLLGIDALNVAGNPLGVDLLPVELRPASSGVSRLNRILLLGGVVLLGALMLTALNLRQSTVERMQHEVAEQRRQVEALVASRRELTDTQGAASYLARQKTTQPTMTALLTELSICLGDDTWLEQLEVHDSGDISVSGQSKRASALINRARDCHSLLDPRFQGVIQPDAQTGNDRFSLVAQLAQLNPLAQQKHQAHNTQETSDAPPPNPQ